VNELGERQEGNWWAVQDLNLRPSGCKPDALTAELTAHFCNVRLRDCRVRRNPSARLASILFFLLIGLFSMVVFGFGAPPPIAIAETVHRSRTHL
jgi:hypothetical protein